MVAEKTTENIYIIVSQTGTVLSRLLKLITGAEYNHVSLGLKDDLDLMYSFGRKNAYNPFFGGFVLESPNFGTFKRFSNTEVIVLELEIDVDIYKKISEQIEYMTKNKKLFHYNYLGLCLGWTNIQFRFERYFYCSEFIKEILVKYNIDLSKSKLKTPHPIDFLDIPNAQVIYTGKLKNYSRA